MLETIAMWGGIAGVVVAVFAVIILFLTRQSIIHILNKDNLLFDQNFEIKKQAISSALQIVDEIVEKGDAVKNNPDFAHKARLAYNDLLCVLSDVRIADEFYSIAIDSEFVYNEARIAQFKLMCRKDIGLKVNKAQTVKRVLAQQKQYAQQIQQPIQQAQPVQQAPVQEPIQYVQPQQPPIQQTQPTQRVAQPQVRPVQQTRPVAQPRPVQAQPVRRVQPIKKDDKPN